MYLLPLRVSVDLEVMARKGYSTLLRSPELEPQHQMQLSVLRKTPLYLDGAYYPSLGDTVCVFSVPPIKGNYSMLNYCYGTIPVVFILFIYINTHTRTHTHTHAHTHTHTHTRTYIYIYIYSSTDRLFRCITTHQYG